MAIESSKVAPLIKRALDYRAIRQDMISSNLANVDTPFYRPRDINFESHLVHETNKIFNKQDELKLDLALTNPRHLKPYPDVDLSKATIFYRDGHLARNDANSVDLDVESTEMSKNAVMYTALTEALKKDGAIFKAVLQANPQ